MIHLIGRAGAPSPQDLEAVRDELAALHEALAETAAQASYVDNSLLLLFSGMVVMFMAAGFCALEAGLVRERNAATICLKNVTLFAIAGLAYYFVGYELMYGLSDGGKFIGRFAVWAPGALDDADGNVASSANWFFQMVFVATAASIVSGTLAERMKLAPFLIFVVFLTAFIYPIQGAWKWGEGWLHQLGFLDFAGSTLVHSVGGWAALIGAIVLGPRAGRYLAGGRVTPMPGSNLPLASIGVFILWLGWFGFNGGSQLAAGTISDINAVAKIMANTNTAAAGGVLAALLASKILYKKPDLTLVLNGAIGGLVSITAQPLAPALWQAALIGAVGGVLVVVLVPVLDRLRIDDVVGAIPAHLACGIWGTLAVALTHQEGDLNMALQFLVQAAGIAAIGAFVCVTSAVVWLTLRFTMGLRVSDEDQIDGLDQAELGQHAYPYFARSGEL